MMTRPSASERRIQMDASNKDSGITSYQSIPNCPSCDRSFLYLFVHLASVYNFPQYLQAPYISEADKSRGAQFPIDSPVISLPRSLHFRSALFSAPSSKCIFNLESRCITNPKCNKCHKSPRGGRGRRSSILAHISFVMHK